MWWEQESETKSWLLKHVEWKTYKGIISQQENIYSKRHVKIEDKNALDNLISKRYTLRKNLFQSNISRKFFYLLIKNSRKSHDKSGIRHEKENVFKSKPNPFSYSLSTSAFD